MRGRPHGRGYGAANAESGFVSDHCLDRLLSIRMNGRRMTFPSAPLLGAALLIGVLCGCQVIDRTRPVLAVPGNGAGFGISVDDAGAGTPFVIGSVPLCLSYDSDEAPPTARLTAVRPAAPKGGLTIDRFTVREHHAAGPAVQFTGAEPGTVPTPVSVDVAAKCPTDLSKRPDVIYELIVQASKEGVGPASAQGVIVEYEVDGERDEFTLPMTLQLCPRASDLDGCVGGNA